MEAHEERLEVLHKPRNLGKKLFFLDTRAVGERSTNSPACVAFSNSSLSHSSLSHVVAVCLS